MQKYAFSNLGKIALICYPLTMQLQKAESLLSFQTKGLLNIYIFLFFIITTSVPPSYASLSLFLFLPGTLVCNQSCIVDCDSYLYLSCHYVPLLPKLLLTSHEDWWYFRHNFLYTSSFQ